MTTTLPIVRRSASAVALALCSTVLVACGSDSDESPTSSESPSGSVSAPEGGGGPGGSTCTESGATPSAAPDGAVPATPDAAAVEEAVTASQAFLETLSEDQRTAAVFDYTDLDGKRCSWSNFPLGLFDGRQGAQLGDLDDDQKAAAYAAVESLLSATGYEYVNELIAADATLSGGGEFGEDAYFLAFYGDPATDSAWTLQFGGHHLAVHISLGGDALSVSPYFQGLQPVSYEVDGTTIEAMSADADAVFGIFESMSEEQVTAAELSGSYDDLVMGPGTDTDFPEVEGLSYDELDAEGQQLVLDAINAYVADARPEVAEPLVELYTSQLAETSVGWSGSFERDSAAYMRISGPRLWIEWVNTGNPGEDGIHYHTAYRDQQLDYGTGAEE